MGRKYKYIPGLDGLRAIAVTGVLISHYLTDGHWMKQLPWGLLGVYMFFALSGYLITNILLRDSWLETEYSPVTVLKRFYFNRALRIFPPYYTLIIVYLLAGVEFENQSLWSCLLYYFNFQEIIITSEYRYIGHFWTLCIEEQFYLVWPLVVLTVSRSRLFVITVCVILLAPVYRFVMALNGIDFSIVRNIPLSAFDSLGLGALLAQLHHGENPKWHDRWKQVYPYVGLFAVAVYLMLYFYNSTYAIDASLTLFCSAMLTVALIEYCTSEHKGFLKLFLELPPVRFIGRISYGIYLYHFFGLFVLYKLMKVFSLEQTLSKPELFALTMVGITLVISTGSFYFLEKPLRRFKK